MEYIEMQLLKRLIIVVSKDWRNYGIRVSKNLDKLLGTYPLLCGIDVRMNDELMNGIA
jgi:hypothetical protein